MADETAVAETEAEVTAEAPTNAEAPAEAPVEAAPEAAAEDQGAEAAPQEGEGESNEQAPSVPDTYDIALAEEVKLAGGQAVTFNAEDPMLKEFEGMARDMGMGQEDFTKFLTLGANFLKSNIDAQTTVSQQQVQEQLGKLGATKEAQTARVEKLSTALAKLGGEQAAFSIMGDIRSAEAFEAVEKLVERANGSGGNRTPALTGSIKAAPALEQALFGKTSPN